MSVSGILTLESGAYPRVWRAGRHCNESNAAVNVNPVDTKSILGKKVVAQNSTLIHPGPQVNSPGSHSFSHQFSTFPKLYLLDMMKISPGIRHHSFFWTTGIRHVEQIPLPRSRHQLDVYLVCGGGGGYRPRLAAPCYMTLKDHMMYRSFIESFFTCFQGFHCFFVQFLLVLVFISPDQCPRQRRQSATDGRGDFIGNDVENWSFVCSLLREVPLCRFWDRDRDCEREPCHVHVGNTTIKSNPVPLSLLRTWAFHMNILKSRCSEMRF
jgi:hypothetical protein